MSEIVLYKIYGLRVIGESEIRYIGLTKNSLTTRLRGHRKEKTRNPYKIKWVAKNKGHIEITLIEENIKGLANANQREKFYISHYKSLGNRLLNATDGGDGTSGAPAWNKGIPCSIIDKVIANSPKSRAVNCFNLDGTFIDQYRSVKFASLSCGVARATIASIANNKPGYKQSKGLIFKWANDKSEVQYKKRTYGEKIECIETGQIYPSISEAAKMLGITFSKLQTVVFDHKFSQSDIQNKKHKTIKCNETGAIYNSIQEAIREIGAHKTSINDFFSGRRAHVKGYTFKRI